MGLPIRAIDEALNAHVERARVSEQSDQEEMLRSRRQSYPGSPS